MKERLKGLSLCAATVGWAFWCAGCVPLLLGAAAGAGGYAYIKGALAQNIDATVEELHPATLAACKELGLFMINDDVTRHSAVMNAEDERGQNVSIKIDAITEYVSKVTIRIGLIGDQSDSRVILREIERQLE